ncbi:unnamed protein product, partial [Amoebophrya sp. A25]|eukprot:GSA25T00016251001.1
MREARRKSLLEANLAIEALDPDMVSSGTGATTKQMKNVVEKGWKFFGTSVTPALKDGKFTPVTHDDYPPTLLDSLIVMRNLSGDTPTPPKLFVTDADTGECLLVIEITVP